MRCYKVLFICLCVVSLLFAEGDLSVGEKADVEQLELAGGDSFEYDIDNKIRRAKSSVQVGVGINFTHNVDTKALQLSLIHI